MPVIKTTVDEETYAELVRKRKRAGLPSVSALFLKSSGVLTDQHEANEIVTRALKLAKKQESGFEFRLRDLFDDDQWERFSKGARIRAGRMFYDKISAATHGIRAEGKGWSGHQLYVVA